MNYFEARHLDSFCSKGHSCTVVVWSGLIYLPNANHLCFIAAYYYPKSTKHDLAANKFNNSRLTDLEILSFNFYLKQRHLPL